MNKSSVLTLAALCLLWAVSPPAQANNVWFSDGPGLNVLDPATGNFLTIPLGDAPIALARDPVTDGAWLATQTQATLLAQSGQVLKSVDLASLGVHPVRAMAVNPYDGSLWLADERSILKLDRYGQPLTSTQLPTPARALHVGVDESLWALGNKLLLNLGTGGNVRAAWRLEAAEEEPKFVGTDDLGGIVWVAGGKTLTQLDRQNPSAALRQIRLPYPLDGFALDEKNGTAWVVAGDSLLSLGRDGTLLSSHVLTSLGVIRPYSMALDHATRTLWIGHANGIVQVGLDGALLRALATERPVSQVAATSFWLKPSISLLRPGLDALTNDPRPIFTLRLDALCSATPCGFAGDYLRGLALSALLDSRPIGDRFMLDEDARQANYLPAEPLREGPNTFSAQARDGFGHISDKIETTVTVDTIPPGFLAVEPADASMLTVDRVNVVVTIDDPSGVVVLEGVGANGAAATTENSATFVYPLILLPGLNTFKLSAIDRAGNIATRFLTLNYVTARIEIEQPVDGASVLGKQVIVSGTWQGPENTGVTVNGVVASLLDGRFYASVPLEAGANMLTATATTREGFSAQQSIVVTNAGPAPIEVSASPHSGVAPLEVSFEVLAGSEGTIQRVDADFDGNGSVDLTIAGPAALFQHFYTARGVYPARFVVTDGQGSATVQQLQIVVEDAAGIDRMLRSMWSGFTTALFHGDKAGAIEYLNGRAREQYGPVFDALLPGMGAILGSFSELQSVSLDSNVAEYAVNRTIEGVNRIFFIYYLRDIDGVWRLDSM